MPFTNFFDIPNISQILLVFFTVIIVLVVFFILYRIAYKIYINRFLAKGRHDGKKRFSPMITPAGLMITTGVAAAITVAVILICMINFVGLVAEQNAQYISDIYRNQAAMEQKANMERITYKYSFEAGEVHDDTKTVDLTLKLSTGLTLGTNDKLTFRVGDSKTEMRADEKGIYTGTVQVSAFRGHPAGILTLESEGEKISQIIEDTPIVFASTEDEELYNFDVVGGTEWVDMYPSAEAYVSDGKEEELENGDVRIQKQITVYPHAAKANPKKTFTKMKLVIEQNKQTVCEADLLNGETEAKDKQYLYDLDITVKEGMLKYYIIAKDADGNQYKMYFESGWIVSSKSGTEKENSADHYEESGSGGYCVKITDKNGKNVGTADY